MTDVSEHQKLFHFLIFVTLQKLSILSIVDGVNLRQLPFSAKFSEVYILENSFALDTSYIIYFNYFCFRLEGKESFSKNL